MNVARRTENVERKCVQYTASMPVDVSAEVLANTPLSSDYNVLALAAPAIAAAAAPGQFVMVKVARGHDPLLRRPFSIFEVLRDARGVPSGISLLNKRIGVSTDLIYRAAAGTPVACLGPLGRPFLVVDPPTEAWMVAGGVGLAPFAALADSVARSRRPDHVVLRRPPRRGAFLSGPVPNARRRARAHDRKWQQRRAWPRRRPSRTPARRDSIRPRLS